MKTPFWCPVLVLLAAACPVSAGSQVDLSVSIHLGKQSPPPPPAVIVVEEDHHHGPPPWAPAHGRRAKQAYYYYPASGIYYRPADRTWFYLEGENWSVGAVLPSHIHVNFDHCVSVELDDDRPYRRHREISAYYSTDYFLKVKLDSGNGNARYASKSNRHDDHPGNGKGNGKSKGKGKGKGKKK
jgi:hypothetical protein